MPVLLRLLGTPELLADLRDRRPETLKSLGLPQLRDEMFRRTALLEAMLLRQEARRWTNVGS